MPADITHYPRQELVRVENKILNMWFLLSSMVRQLTQGPFRDLIWTVHIVQCVAGLIKMDHSFVTVVFGCCEKDFWEPFFITHHRTLDGNLTKNCEKIFFFYFQSMKRLGFKNNIKSKYSSVMFPQCMSFMHTCYFPFLTLSSSSS